jgi:hypothetical protein
VLEALRAAIAVYQEQGVKESAAEAVEVAGNA